MNKESLERTKQCRIDLEIREHKRGWLGHTLRKPSEDIARQALEWNPQGKRGKGRPRNTWRRTVLEEAKGVKKTQAEIKTDATNRVRWRILVEALCLAAERWDLSSSSWICSSTEFPELTQSPYFIFYTFFFTASISENPIISNHVVISMCTISPWIVVKMYRHYIYEGESIIIRTVCFIFIKTRAEILQLYNFSTQSPCFTMHSVHHRTICFMTSE